MGSYFDNYCDFSVHHASPSGRTPAPTNYPHNFYPHEPCSYCSDPCHSSSNCPYWGQFCNLSFEQMNSNSSSPGFESNSNFYNPDCSDYPDFSWQAQAMGNCAPQFQELHYPDCPQFDNQSSHPSSYVYPASSSQSTLEDTLKVFMELTGQAISDVKNATMENTQAIARIEGKLEYLVAEVTRIEEEEFQSQLMAQGHYMIDEDDASHSDHEHAPAITILESEETVDSIGGEGREEHLEPIAPPPNPNTSNDKEMSTEAHSFIIPPKGYQVLKKKGWKGLVGHPHDRGRRCKFSFPF
jgi:hypothetical protein